MKKYAVFASIGFEFIAIVIGCYYLGAYFDAKYNGAGTYSAIAILFGFAGWITHIIFLVKKLNSPDSGDKNS